MSDADFTACGITLGLIILDVLFGLAGALAHNKFQSSVMRQGLWHKTAEIGLIVCMYLVQTFPGYEVNVGVPSGGLTCAYIALMEIGSIIENIGELNPELKNTGLWVLLKGDSDDSKRV